MDKKSENEIKELELNTKILKNFEEIISMKLDQIETLRITELDNGSKLLNILSLCANLKTLIISGNLRLNTDQIIKNVFKADKLEKLVLSDVRLPQNKTLKKCINLKEISLNSIRVFDIKDFFENGVANKNSLEKISITNSDMSNMSIDFLVLFNKLKYLEIDNLLNCPFTNLYFIKDNNKLQELIIKNSIIPISEINNIISFNGIRKIDVNIKECPDARLKVDEKNCLEIFFPGDRISYFSENINLIRINRFNIKIENGIDDFEKIRLLLECQKKVIFLVNDYSSLSIEQANIIKEILQIYYIQIKENEQIKEISIDKYIQNKNQIIDILKIVNYSDTEVQKFLKIYKSLSLRIAFIDNHKQDSKIFCTKKDVAIILQRCLQCVNINSNIIYGEELENGKEHYWNQVKIDGKWYNVDLALDIPKLKKKKSDYCLVDDEDFYEFHNAKSGEKHYCKEEYNYKFIRVFLKTGIFKEQLLSSYIEIMKTQFKKIFENNKKEKILALPSGKTHEKI